jgi:DNA polymerase-1
MEFDAAGQEFRWMAEASRDDTMLELCLPGEDPHSYMGARIARVDYRTLIELVHQNDKPAKGHRQLGKVANLSLQYRTSAPKLRTVARVQYQLPMTKDESQYIRTTYINTYRGVPQYWDRQIAMTKRTGYVETLAGRQVQVRGNWAGDFGWSMGSTAINYRIQGTGADQKYLALSVLRPYITRIGAYFAWELHDGIYFYVPDAMVPRAAVEIKAILDNLPYQKAWGFTPSIPLPWDCKAGKSWGNLKEWNYDH